MRMRRLLAALLLLSMIVSIVPTSAFSVDTNDGSNNVSSGETTATAVGSVVAPKDNLFLSNIAKLEADGTYTIDLSAYATAERITQSLESGYPLDVVLVISQTGTLHANGTAYDGAPLAALKQSVTDFVEGLKDDGEANGHKHRIAICGYASDEYGGWDNMVNKDTGALYGYSFAGDQKDWIFTNTGLFVNGEFKNYGSGTHTLLTEEEKAVDKLTDGTTFVAKANEAYQETLGDQYYIIKYETSKKQWWYFRYSDFVKLYGSPTVGKAQVTPEDAVTWLTERFNLYKHDNTITYNLEAEDYQNSWEYVSDNGALNEDITNAIDSLAANGGRNAVYGLKMARQMLKNAPDIEGEEGVERKKIVIVFANDQFGSNGDTNNNSVRAEAQKIKSDPEDGAEIYTVGINSGTASTFWSTMEMISSDAYTYVMTPTGTQTSYATNTGNKLVKNNLLRFTSAFFYMVTNDDGTVDYYPVIAYSDPGPTNHKWYYVTDTGKVHIESNDGQNSLGGLYHIQSNSYDATAGYCLRSDDYNDLSGLFLSVIEKSKIYHNGKLDKGSRLKYVLADNFKLTEKSTITVSVVPGSVTAGYESVAPKELTSDKITWGEAKQLLSYSYDTSNHSYPNYSVPGAADQTKMTIYARAYATGEINFTGFNYALQCIYADHAGSKLEVKITGVEVKPGVATNTEEFINHNTSGIYEGTDRDWDGDGTKGNIQMVLPDAKTYLRAVTYQVNNNGSVTIDPEDFSADPEDFSAVHVSLDVYNYFDTPCTTLSMEYGQATINNDGTVTYEKFHPEWEHNEVFYLFGKIDNTNVEGASTNVDNYVWYKITIVEADDSRGSLFLDKTATLTGNGTYTIDLEAYATGTPSKSIVSEGIPLDVVLVIDQSGSLAYEKDEDGNMEFNGKPLKRLKESVTEFVETLKANGEAYGINHRISMCGFASGERQGNSGTSNVRGYTYASDLRQEAWCNTGLFVDGKFREYATMDYVPVKNMEELDTGRQYSVRIDPDGDGNYEYTSAHYSTRYGWLYNYGRGSDYLIQPEEQAAAPQASHTELFWEKYKGRIYLPGKSTLRLKDADYAASWENIASGENGQGGVNPDITNVIDKLAANGATYTIYGLKMARHMLNNIPELEDGVERKKVVIVFTDGVPGSNGITDGDADAALSEAMKIKNENIEIYAIGVYQDPSDSEVHDFMNRLSSNYYSHSFATKPVRIDMSQIKDQDRSGNTSLNPTIGGSYPEGNGKSGITPYYYEKDGAYYPIVISNNYENPGVYYASYISDEVQAGGVLIASGAWDEIPDKVGDVYMLTEHNIDKGRDTNYYKYSDDIDNMTEIFEKIASKVTSNSIEVSLGVDAIMKDVLADGFTLTDNTQITVSVVPGSVKEQFADVGANSLGSEHISWGAPQQVLTFKYSEAKKGTGNVIVNGAADKTEMTLSAQATEDGIITVTGFNYAEPLDDHKQNAQYICADHPGSKLVVTITGVEAKNGVTTDSFTVTNKGTSGIYEAPNSDLDGDNDTGELQASFPIPATYLSSKTYYVDYSGELIIDPADFLMTIEGYSLDKNGYHGFGAPDTTIELDHGTVTVLNDGKLKFTMKSDGLDITDTFYLFGHTDNATVKAAMANTTGNMWSKITIITPEDITGKLITDKVATLNKDGTYTIDLSAFATGTPSSTVITEGVPLDVVLVVDQSASMAKGSAGADMLQTKEIVADFVQALYANGESFGINHRISICGFGTEGMEGTPHCVDKGYSYADEQYDQAWINTGIFVNGGFKKYGKAEYTPVTSAEEISGHGFYLLKCEFEERDKNGNKTGRIVTQFPSVQIDGGSWRLCIDSAVDGQYPFLVDENGEKFDSTEVLFENYGDRLYKMESHALQLTPADYAASWENLANGANGTGGVNPTIQTHISKFGAAGCTRIQYGLNMARKMLENIPDANDGIQRKKIVVVFADGLPSYSSYYLECIADPAMVEAGLIKDMGVEIFGISLANEKTQPKQSEFITRLSSNCPAPEFKEATFDITKAQAKTNAHFMLNYAIPGISYAKAPLFYKVGDKYYQIRAYWPKKTQVLSGDYLSEASGISVHYITDAGDVLICKGDSVEEINAKMAGQPVYEIIEPVVNDQTGTKYLLTASSVDELSKAFSSVTNEMTTYSTEVALDATAILKDVMADGFTLTNNTQITVSVVPGSVKEGFADVGANRLGSEHIDWGAPQKVLTFKYSEEKEGTGNVIVNGAADQTEMTLSAQVTEDGIITVTGFNYAAPLDNRKQNAQYICAGHPGSKLVVTITGVEAKADVVTDSNTTTNKGTSGIYEGPDSDLDGDNDKGELQASFPIPTTRIASKVYVMDYAKTMVIDPIDFLMSLGFSLDMDGEGYEDDERYKDGYNYFDSNSPVTKLTGDYGNVELKDGKLTYTPTKTNWNGFDTFHVFGTTENATVKKATANANGNMWAKISVIPANNVYYEDTFVTNDDTGTAGIIYTGAWEIVSETDHDSNKEHAESGESTEKDLEGKDHQGGVHGWEDDLADDTGFSDGSAHVAGKDGSVGATATFTFTGTGVDIYSRTNRETGMVIAMLYEGTGKNPVAQYSIMVDNLAASGDYYQIPTLSFFKIPARDENGKIIKEDDGSTRMIPLPHGTYTVKLIASKVNEPQTGSARFLYYLDGIRVYNPIKNLEENETVSGAYGEKELNANFVEIRDELLDAGCFSAEENESAGVVFIDRITSEDGTHDDNAETFEIGTYKELGPKNEVYLSAGQLIAFAVPYREGAHYYVGLKSLTKQAARAITNSTGIFVNAILVGHTTDMYYEVTPEWETNENGEKIGIIYIHADPANGHKDVDGNYNGAILSVTKLKVTGPEAKTFRFARISTAKLLEYIEEDLAPAVEEDTSSPDEEEAKPEEPGEDADKPGSGTNNDEQSALQKLMREILRIIFGNLRSWFKS